MPLGGLTSLFERQGYAVRLKDSNASPGAALGRKGGHAEGEDLDHTSPSEPPEDPVWRVSKRGVATVDQSVDVSQLRWVGTEFIYFIDIPWDYEFREGAPEIPDARRGLDEDALHPEHKADSSSTKLSTHSITIGLLEDIMDMQIPVECLLSLDDSGQRVLSSDLLSRLVVPWAQQLHSLAATHSHDPASLEMQRGTHSRDTLKAITTSLDRELYSKSGSLVDDGPDSDMMCAMAIMLSSLENCIRAIWKVGGGEVVERTQMFGEVNQILRQKLSAKWGQQASFEMERLLSGGVPFAAYAISLQRTVNNVSIVDTVNYKPKHVTSSCTCAFIKPSLSAVCELVRENKVPILVYDGTELLVRSAGDFAYVAISHVWADGLGSTTEEGLPGCQIQRLAHLAGKLVPDGAFWQDGLCIPGQKEHRNRAIAFMKETYADADKVLVLDEGLRTSCSLSTPKEECLLRIATSGWMQRVWTLQEGMLARELHFQLMDDIIDCTHFNGYSFALAQKVFPLLQYRRGETALTYDPRSDNPPTCIVNEIIGLLRYRTTSKPRDEPVAISGLLGINTGTLIHLESGEERMKNLLIQARELPRQLAVFGWMCPRLSIPNFGWAPTSLSEVLWPGDPDDPRKAVCTEDGLFGEFTVVRFDPVTFWEPFGIILIVKETGGQSETESRVFNLVLSPFFFRFPEARPLTVGGFLMKGKALEESMREEGVGAMVFPSELHPLPHPVDERPSLACKFVAPASVRFGLPDRVETSRTRYAWLFAYATVEPFRVVRVI
ncbi:hypothetical protein C8R44DRAFT_148489 [Mycena epipterygia]|nr:hypothetical protein C8R44DRAFT_148489 [Mycena epipterygia]